jgi:hypothetical protein
MDNNFNGIGDTTNVPSFRVDSLKVTKAFQLSAYENLRIDILCNDTTTAGFTLDTANFKWGFQTGHQIMNGSGKLDTLWNPQRIVCDTFKTLSGVYGLQYTILDSTGVYNEIGKIIDTTSVSGFAVQSKNISPMWDCLIRVWVKGLSGNQTHTFLKLWVNIVHRKGVATVSGE